MQRFISGLTLLCLPLLLSAAELQPFKAEYRAAIGSVSADATRQLSQDQNGHWQLSQQAKNFFASVSETSDFSISDQGLISEGYEYSRSAFGSKRHALLKFNWDDNKVTNDVEGQPWSYDVEEGTLDKLNFQLQLRLDLQQQRFNELVYPVADGGTLKEYRFRVLGEEQLKTDIGTLSTLKVERIYPDNADKQTWLWFSRDHDYLLVRYLQSRDQGKKKTELAITAID